MVWALSLVCEGALSFILYNFLMYANTKNLRKKILILPHGNLNIYVISKEFELRSIEKVKTSNMVTYHFKQGVTLFKHRSCYEGIIFC